MSIQHLELNTFKQVFDVSNNNKALYGEVHTDFNLIHKILDLIPPVFSRQNAGLDNLTFFV